MAALLTSATWSHSFIYNKGWLCLPERAFSLRGCGRCGDSVRGPSAWSPARQPDSLHHRHTWNLLPYIIQSSPPEPPTCKNSEHVADIFKSSTCKIHASRSTKVQTCYNQSGHMRNFNIKTAVSQNSITSRICVHCVLGQILRRGEAHLDLTLLTCCATGYSPITPLIKRLRIRRAHLKWQQPKVYIQIYHLRHFTKQRKSHQHSKTS